MPPGEGTVRGTFDLTAEPALRSLRDLRTAGRDTDQTFRRLGASIDTYAGQVDRGFSKMARSAAGHTKEINASVDSSIEKVREFGRLDEKARVGLDGAQDVKDDIRSLSGDVRDFGRLRETAHVQLSGVAQASRQLAMLEAQLTRFAHRHATATARIRTTGGGGLGGLGGAGRAAGGGGLSMPPMGLLGLGGLALLPAIPALGGTALGLAGSAAAGATAAGVVGGTGLGVLGVGLAPAVGVTRALTKDIGIAMKAQTAYNMAVAQYGPLSTQAATAKRRLDAVYAQNPGIRKATQEVDALRTAVTQLITAPTRRTVAAAVGTTLGRVRTQALPALAPGARLDIQATSQEATRFGGFLTRPGGPVLSALTATQRQFAQDLPIIERGLENVATLFANVERAALPFFHQGVLWVEHTTQGWATWSQNTAKVNATLQHGVTSFTRWRDLTSATFHTLRDLFSLGRPTGDSAVQSLTNQLNQWDAWIKRNPAKVQEFFRNAWTDTKRIAGAVWEIAKALGQVANLLAPVLGRFAQLTQLLGGAGLLLPFAARAGLGYMLGRRDPAVAAMMGGRGVFGMGAAAGAVGAGGAAEMGMLRNAGFAYSAGRAAGMGRIGAGLGVAAGLGRTALGVAGRVAWPLALVSGGLGAAQYGTGGIGASGLVQNFASGASLGLIHPAVGATGGQIRDAATQAALTVLQHGGRGYFSAGSYRGTVGAPRVSSHFDLFGPGISQARAPIRLPTIGDPHALQDQMTAYQRLTAVLPVLERAELRAHGKAKQAIEGEIRAVQGLRSQYATAGQQIAQKFSQNFGSAFAYWSKRDGPIKAMGEMRTGIIGEMRRLDPAGKRVLANNAVAWAYQMAKDNPKMRKPYEDLVRSITGQFHSMGQDIKVVNGMILDNSRTQWLNIASNIEGPMQVAAAKTTGLFGQIEQAAIGKLTLMGFSRTQAQQLVKGIESGKIDPKNVGKGSLSPTSVRMTSANTPRSGRATGGRLYDEGGRIPGFGLHDTVRMVDGGRGAPGELVVNRHTERDVNADLISAGKRPLSERVAMERRPHSLGPLALAPAPAHHQLGGILSGIASAIGHASGLGARGTAGTQTRGLSSQVSLAGVHQGVLDAARAIMQHFPSLTITSSTGGTHAAGSYHYKGEALDLAGGGMDSAANWIKTSGLYRSLVEGIHNPNLAVSHGQIFSGAGPFGGVWAGHRNHIHIAVTGGIGAVGGGTGGQILSISLDPPKSGLPGIPGVYADTASKIFTGGLVQRVNESLAAMGPVGGGGGVMGGSGPWKGVMAQIAQQKGWNLADWEWIVQHESGGIVSNKNPTSTAFGLGQLLAGTYAQYGGGPGSSGAEQITAMAKYIAARYKNPTAAKAFWEAHHWYSQGGRLPEFLGWFARGTDFTTTPGRPVMFGAGERPGQRERVQITPAGSASASGGPVHFHPGAIVVHGDGADPEAIGEMVATKIIEALDRGEVPDSALT